MKVYCSLRFDVPVLTFNNYLPTKLIVQEKDTFNEPDFTDVFRVPREGRLIGLDPGTKRIGVAVSDELQFTARPLQTLERPGWKKLLLQIKEILAQFDAVALVIGLPYNFDGTESEMSREARRLARNFALSLSVPVVLQDERMTSYVARGNMWKQGASGKKVRQTVDAEAAAIIVRDFIELRNELLARGEK
jgi:putative holliday junction resolvase